MGKLFLSLIIVLFFTGCSGIPIGSDGTRLLAIYHNVYSVRVINNCTASMDIETVRGRVVKGLPYGKSTMIKLNSLFKGDRSQSVPLIVKGYVQRKPGREREYYGSSSRDFYINPQVRFRAEDWPINSLTLPSGRGGCP